MTTTPNTTRTPEASVLHETWCARAHSDDSPCYSDTVPLPGGQGLAWVTDAPDGPHVILDVTNTLDLPLAELQALSGIFSLIEQAAQAKMTAAQV